MVRALFAVARSQQPAVVFIDEIVSLLTQRTGFTVLCCFFPIARLVKVRRW